tara:strand:+ start:546 stop:683 length:138 start_codon:yes stop_codon:yes gene_type:complete
MGLLWRWSEAVMRCVSRWFCSEIASTVIKVLPVQPLDLSGGVLVV